MRTHDCWQHCIRHIKPLKCTENNHRSLEICIDIWVENKPKENWGYLPPLGKDIPIEDQVLTQVNKFKYLGTTVTHNNRIDTELDTRTSNGSKAFGGVRNSVWFNKDLSIKTKCAVYCAIILTTLLHGAETWKVYKPDDYIMCPLCKIRNVKW